MLNVTVSLSTDKAEKGTVILGTLRVEDTIDANVALHSIAELLLPNLVEYGEIPPHRTEDKAYKAVLRAWRQAINHLLHE